MITIAVTGIAIAALVLLVAGVPVVFSFGLATIGMALVTWPGTVGLNLLALNSYTVVTSETLIALPLFVLMAEIIMVSGIGKRVFDAVQRLFWRVPGGLAATSMFASIGFAAITGSSAANTATVGGVAVKEMLDRNYDKRLTVGSIAAGGALGILIPPSTFMIVYGSLSNTSIAELFMAGVIPGLMLGGAFVVLIIIRAMLNPALAPRLNLALTPRDYVGAALQILPVAALSFGMLGAIYAGIATPNEIGALGVAGALLIAIVQEKLGWREFMRATRRAVVTTSMIFWIMIGTWSFGYILNYLGFGATLARLIQEFGVSQLAILLTINVLLFILGMFLDPGAIIMLVTPLALPVLRAAEIDLIWFGIIFVINMELGMITPPFGINLFIMKGIAPPEVSMSDIVRGAVPFMVIEVIAIGVLIMWPQIALWLPGIMR